MTELSEVRLHPMQVFLSLDVWHNGRRHPAAAK
jgi:hypothetical protein